MKLEQRQQVRDRFAALHNDTYLGLQDEVLELVSSLSDLNDLCIVNGIGTDILDHNAEDKVDEATTILMKWTAKDGGAR